MLNIPKKVQNQYIEKNQEMPKKLKKKYKNRQQKQKFDENHDEY